MPGRRWPACVSFSSKAADKKDGCAARCRLQTARAVLPPPELIERAFALGEPIGAVMLFVDAPCQADLPASPTGEISRLNAKGVFQVGGVLPCGRNRGKRAEFCGSEGVGSVFGEEEVAERGTFHEKEDCKYRDRAVPLPFA